MVCDLDVTNWSNEKLYELLNTDRKDREVCYSAGVYGLNAIVIQLESGRTVKCTSRNTNAFILN